MELMIMLASVAVGISVCYLFKSAIDDLRFKKLNNDKNTEPMNRPEQFINVSVTDMDKHYDRSAGRWCDACGIHGSHHTDKHSEFAKSLPKVNS